MHLMLRTNLTVITHTWPLYSVQFKRRLRHRRCFSQYVLQIYSCREACH